MSVFKVALNNVDQGLLDLDPSTASAGAVTGQGLGSQMQPSIQRGVYIMGPNLVNRLLIDGETFTDCNYWKKFAYPQVPLNEAFVSVIDDDGSIYSDVASENTYPKVYDRTIAGGDTFGDNEIDIVGDTGGFASFAQITNNGSGPDIKVRLNGLTDAAFDLAAGDTQVFNSGDLSISLIEFDNTASGASDADVQVILSIRSICNS
ncbi:MAG: hypothetical protein ACW99G_00545 [Candidatus Thorarchaeota archaeon]|jgi:hypothetical protein